MTSTTIKVSKELRDRIADRARRDSVTLAGAISRALDEADEHMFWQAVVAEHAALSADDRAETVPAGTLSDDLDDATDDLLSVEGGW